MKYIIAEIMRYIRNYKSRHANKINFILHIVGIPEVFFGIFQILVGTWKIGLLNVFLGYLWQWIGHGVFEGNEVGEISGIKKIIDEFKKS